MIEPVHRFYADATALIGLARINHLDLLTVLPIPVCVTRQVWEEVAHDLSKPGAMAILQAREAGLLLIVDEGNREAFPMLGSGEASVLDAAASARGAVLLDERRARAVMDANAQLQRAISARLGVVGLLRLAKNRGLIASVGPLLDALRAEGFHISERLRRETLRQAGEA